MTTILQSTLTCPECGTQAVETMPIDACLYFYTCTGCGTRLKPKRGDCCVFCSYGSVPCPPIQEGAGSACCGDTTTTPVPEFCSLEPGPFRERVGEITALLQSFDGSVHPTPTGVELRFRAGDGVRAALDMLAEKERSCCATLAFTVMEQAGAVSFRIDGREGDLRRIDELVARLGLR